MSKELNDKLEQLQQEVAAVKKQIKEAERESTLARQMELRPVAELAHSILCTWNHTDGCSWGYEGDNWESDAHSRWLTTVENLCKEYNFTIEQATDILVTVRRLKVSYPRAVQYIKALRG